MLFLSVVKVAYYNKDDDHNDHEDMMTLMNKNSKKKYKNKKNFKYIAKFDNHKIEYINIFVMHYFELLD